MFNETLYRISQLEEWFRQDRKTIIAHVELYESHFSDHATRRNGDKQRNFTSMDVRVYRTIRRLESERKKPDEIKLYLSGQNDLDPMPESGSTINYEETALVMRQQVLSIEGQRDAALAQVKTLEQELDLLKEQMRTTTLDMAKWMAQREGELQAEITRLKIQLEQREIPRLNGKEGL